MKIFTIILIFFLFCSNLKSQVLELNGTWRAKETSSFGWTEYLDLVFKNDSLLLVISGPIGSWAYYEVGTFEIRKDTLVHFIGEHLKMNLNTGHSKHYKNSPIVKKYCFKMESDKINFDKIPIFEKTILLEFLNETSIPDNKFVARKKNDSTTIFWNAWDSDRVTKMDY